MGTHWTAENMPDLSGTTAVVTGANSGLGLVTSLELARHGAAVTMACRDSGRGAAALAQVRAEVPAAAVEVRPLDLADLASVRSFASRWADEHPEGLSLLVNNAGVMAVARSTTVDGFERQLGTNHLGPFALTGLLLPSLLERRSPRVVTVSSQAHRFGRLSLDDLASERSYSRWRAYGQSKLANLLFGLELQRRADAARAPLLSVMAHPGYASTNLAAVAPTEAGKAWRVRFGEALGKVVAQSAERGALPQLFAATSSEVHGGAYVGPDGFGEQRGHPRLVSCSDAARDPATATALWTASEELTGVTYAWPASG